MPHLFAHFLPFWFTEPMLIWPKSVPLPISRGALLSLGGPNGPLANFLDDFGPMLVEKYSPRGIVVFSAHWETSNECLGDYKWSCVHPP
jgi:aromatic ring-opening dioxygenase catalytic subunit (LigB family)